MPGLTFADVHVVVVDEGLYVGNGLVARWMRGIGISLYEHIVRAAPVRTGDLKAGIVKEDSREGLRILSTTVASTAAHTQYVVKGTANNGLGLIFSTRGWRSLQGAARSGGIGLIGRARAGEKVDSQGLWMRLSDARDGSHLVVHGQRSNNFLAKGYDAVARTHRSLRPFPYT